MGKFSDQFNSDSSDVQIDISEIWLREDPVLLLLFTDDSDEVNLHFVDAKEVNTFVICPGTRCPLCFAGSAPQVHHLLPVYSIDDSAVRVIKVSNHRGPGALGPALHRLFADPKIADKVVILSHKGKKFQVQTRPLPSDCDHGESAIATFKAARENGLDLKSAFHSLTASELADIEKIHRKVKAMGYQFDGENDQSAQADGNA